MDSHAGWIKARLCALVALLEHRYTPTLEDWARAGAIWETSCRVRSDVVSYGVAQAQEKARQSRHSHAERQRQAAAAVRADERAEEQQRVEMVTRRCALIVIENKQPMTRGAIREKLNVKLRDLIDDAIDVALEKDWLRPEGKRYATGDSRPS